MQAFESSLAIVCDAQVHWRLLAAPQKLMPMSIQADRKKRLRKPLMVESKGRFITSPLSKRLE